MRNKQSLIICIVTTLVLITLGNASAAEIYVPSEQGPTIQGAVNNATDGDTINVSSGTYTENVDVSQANIIIKSQSGNPSNTVVQAANSNDHVFYVTANNVTISGFKVTGATDGIIAGIFLKEVQNNNVSNNKLSNNYNGIRLFDSSSNDLINNTVTDNNNCGIMLYKSSSNSIYNNYFNNTNNVKDYGTNFWNSTEIVTYTYNNNNYENYTGNYYANDYANNPSNDVDGDGIGDTPYEARDNYPLMFWPVIATPSNQAPVADANGPYEGDEGSPITFDASRSSDPDEDELTYAWDFDYDGVNFDVDAAGETATNTWYDNGTYSIAVRVSDGRLTDINKTTVIVNNVAPNITPPTVQPTEPVEVGTDEVYFNATFTDPGSLDTHTWEIDWGDYTTSGAVTGLTVNESHIYDEAGVYTIKLNVTDDDGGFDTIDYQYVVVYDPNGEYVAGEGWIYSPDGAYTADPGLNGTAKFGFVSKYVKDKDGPIGNTVFKFHAGDLNFHSNYYDWLVVNNHKATYKGTGTINREGNYGFMLSAIDAECTPSTDVDLFRIKIWDKDNNDAVVYDNMLGADEDANPITAIQGGAITVQAKK